MQFRKAGIVIGVLLWLLVGCDPAVCAGKVAVHPGVLPAKLIQINSEHILYQAEGRRHRSSTRTAFFVKEGEKVSPDQFHPGERVVLLSTFEDFSLINIVADRVSYAAFCHDLAGSGTVQSWKPGQPLIVSQVRGFFHRGHSEPSKFPTYFYEILPKTQFWLQGVKMTRQQAQQQLTEGTEVFVAMRWPRPKKKQLIKRTLPAYAIFDKQTWRKYAVSDLHHARDLFVPRKPWYPRTRD